MSLQAILALEKFPSQATRQALIDVINQNECFYKVRLEACFCLAKVREYTAWHFFLGNIILY